MTLHFHRGQEPPSPGVALVVERLTRALASPIHAREPAPKTWFDAGKIQAGPARNCQHWIVSTCRAPVSRLKPNALLRSSRLFSIALPPRASAAWGRLDSSGEHARVTPRPPETAHPGETTHTMTWWDRLSLIRKDLFVTGLSRGSAAEVASSSWRSRLESWLYAAFAGLAILYVADLFFGALRLQLGYAQSYSSGELLTPTGIWSAPSTTSSSTSTSPAPPPGAIPSSGPRATATRAAAPACCIRSYSRSATGSGFAPSA